MTDLLGTEAKQLAALLREVSLDYEDETRRRIRQAAFLVARDPTAELHDLLNEMGAPLGDGTVEFALAGRIRALRFDLLTEANQLRAALGPADSEQETT